MLEDVPHNTTHVHTKFYLVFNSPCPHLIGGWVGFPRQRQALVFRRLRDLLTVSFSPVRERERERERKKREKDAIGEMLTLWYSHRE